MARAAGKGGGSDSGRISGSVDDTSRPSLLYTVKQVELATRARMDELVKPAGITALQYTALTVLRRRDGLSSAQLARNSFVTAQSMADLVAGLEGRGLITRRRDPANRRVLLISLTDEGHELLAGFDAEMDALEEQMLSGLTRLQRRDLAEYLNRCRAALSDTPPH